MKILLDTSYLLPFIQVDPENISNLQLKKILENKKHTFQYCDLSIFELVAKGMKICINSDLTIQDVHEGVDSLLYSSPIIGVQWQSHPELFEIAFRIRNIHKDTFDCVIFSTALYFSDCFTTSDFSILNKIKKQQELVEKIITINPDFQIWIGDLQKDPKLIKEYLK